MGHGEAGKTSLFRALAKLDDRARSSVDKGTPVLAHQEDRTIALDIELLWGTFNLYDFGGQRPYKACQQVFLTKGALFVVVVDLLTGEKRCVQAMLEHLNIIYFSVPDATILVVASKADLLLKVTGNESSAYAIVCELNRAIHDWRSQITEKQLRTECHFRKVTEEAEIEEAIPKALMVFTVSSNPEQTVGLDELRIEKLALLHQGKPGGRAGENLFPGYLQLFPKVYEEISIILAALSQGRDPLSVLRESQLSPQRLGRTGTTVRSHARFSELVDEIDKVRVIPSFNELFSEPTGTVLRDALRLLESEGLILVSASTSLDVVHLDPTWLVDALKPLADHRLTLEAASVISDAFSLWTQDAGPHVLPIDSETASAELYTFAKSGVLTSTLFEHLMSGVSRHHKVTAESLLVMLNLRIKNSCCQQVNRTHSSFRYAYRAASSLRFCGR